MRSRSRFPIGWAVPAVLLLAGPAWAQPGWADAPPETEAPKAETPAKTPAPPKVTPVEEAAKNGSEEPPPFSTQSVWKYWKRWHVFAGEDWAVILLGAVLLDTQRFDQDRATSAITGSTDPFETGEVRAVRLGGVATYGKDITSRWSLIVAAAFRGFDAGFEREEEDTWTIFDLALRIPLYQYGWVTVGKQKGFSTMERQMSLLNLAFMERTVANDALLTSRDIGVTYRDVYLNQRITFGIGIYNDFLEEAGDFDDRSTYGSGRITALLADAEEPGELRIHIGGHFRYSNAHASEDKRGQPAGRVAQTPETFFAPAYVDTGAFQYDWIAWYGGELYLSYRSLWFGLEALVTQGDLEAPGLESPVFAAAHGFVTWTITGEPRGYDKTRGIFTAVVPRRSVLDGGYGAFHVGARLSWTDLDSGAVQGGTIYRATVAFTWQPEKLIRVDVNYGYVHLDRGGEVGITHVFHARVGLAF